MNNPYCTIKEIKKVTHAKRACELLKAKRELLPNSDKDAGLTYAYKRAESEFKIGGLAYYKDVCLSHAWKIIEANSIDIEVPSFSRFTSQKHQNALDNRKWVISSVCATIRGA